MLDIIRVKDGFDLGLADTAVGKAGNVVSVQLGSLEYAINFGADLKYFLESKFEIQIASYKAYLVQRLTESQINVSDIMEVIRALDTQLNFFVEDAQSTSKGLIV